MKPKISLILLAVVLWGQILLAQDPVFSQFFAAPLQLNPAFAGTTLAPRFSFNHRNQYPNWPNAYITYAASFEQGLENFNSGIGLQIMTDAAGDGIYRNNYVGGVYSYNVQLGNGYHAQIGLEAGVAQAAVDWDRLLFEDQIDPLNGPDEQLLSEETRPETLTTTLFDASAGILFYNGRSYIGMSMRHINRPNESLLRIRENLFAGRTVRTVIHAGTEIPLGRRNKRGDAAFISPNVLLVKQGDTGQLNLGAYIGAGQLFGGAWFRHNFTLPDAAIALVGVKYGVLKIGYSYDFTVSELASAPGGTGNTHEISLTINVGDSREIQRKRNASRWSNCFKMFQ